MNYRQKFSFKFLKRGGGGMESICFVSHENWIQKDCFWVNA